MLKRNIVAAAVLVTQAAFVHAQALPSDIRKEAAADPAPVRLAPREIWKDPAVFYADNPVAATRDFARKDGTPSSDARSELRAADRARTQPGAAQGADRSERPQAYFADPF